MNTAKLKRVGFIAMVLVQLVLLVGIIYTRQSWVDKGYKVLLRTTPVDPRSLLRGDYVRLNYEMARLDLTKVQNDGKFKKGEYAYVGLKTGEDGVSNAFSVNHAPPEAGMPFIKGRVVWTDQATNKALTVRGSKGDVRTFTRVPRQWRFDDEEEGKRYVFCLSGDGERVVSSHLKAKANKSGNKCSSESVAFEAVITDVRTWKYPEVRLNFTIDSYFVEEGTGKDIERMRDSGQVLVEAALRDDGMPLISALIVNGVRFK